jgi:hypothetical protein
VVAFGSGDSLFFSKARNFTVMTFSGSDDLNKLVGTTSIGTMMEHIQIAVTPRDCFLQGLKRK